MYLRRLRAATLSALVAAFLFETVGRILHATGAAPAIVTELIGLVALLLLCGSALYLIFRLGNVPVLKGLMLAATSVLVLSQMLSILDGLPLSVDEGLSSAVAALNQYVGGVLLVAGFVLMVATLYFALLEAVEMRTVLVSERAELVREIAERREAQLALSDSSNRLRRLSAHLEQVREDERTMVAREIHDELGQTLTSLRIDLANLKRQMDSPSGAPNGDKCQAIVASMSEEIDGTMQVVRRIITQLRPGILDDLGLSAAIGWLTRDFERRTGIACALAPEPDDVTVDRERSTALFRILQEALTNVTRHSGATRVDVALTQTDESIRLEVADNGKGMDRDPWETSKTFGLLGIRERAAQFGGALRIDTARGEGVRLTVDIPWSDSV